MTVLQSVISRLLLLAFIQLVRGGFELRVRTHSYSNPSHQHAGGECCDNHYFPCRDNCDNYFVFCLRPANYSHKTWRCPLGVIHTGEVGGDSLMFRSWMGNRRNPMLFSNSSNWPGSFQLLIAVNDLEDSYYGSYTYFGEFIDAIYIEESLQPNGSFSTPQLYTGTYQRGTISLSFRVSCTENYYGPNCATFCEPNDNHICDENGDIVCRDTHYYGTLCNVFCEGRNDSLGHYQCSQNGSKICLEGYQDPDTNCTTQLCEPECVATGGYCNASGLCQCYSGWRGRQCNECIPNMECSTVGGYCVQPNQCLCREGYTGTGCEIVISEGIPSVSEGTPVISEGTPSVSEGTLAGNTGSSSEFPNTGTMTPIANVGSNGQSASTSNLGLVLGVVFAVLLLLSLAFVIVVVLTVLLCRGREKGVILLNEDRPHNLPLENPTYIPSTLGRHAAEPESANSQQEYNLYNPLYSERDIDLSHYETVDRDSRTTQMSEVIYSTIESGSRQPSRMPPSSSQTPLTEGHYETLNDYATEYMRMPPDDSSG